METSSSTGCDPQSAGYPKVKCNPDNYSCPGKSVCGKSNRKCYCTTTLFPKADPIRKARRQFEKELLPINNNLSDLQNKVRSMYINEMRECICGAFIPDNPFPDPITCTCAKFLGPKPTNEKLCCCDGKSYKSFSSKSSKTTYSSIADDNEPTPCVRVGDVPFARSRKSSRGRSRHSSKRSRSKSKAKSEKDKKHKRKHKSKRSKSRKRSSARKSKKIKEDVKDAELPPLTPSQHDMMCRRLLALARNMFYKGPLSHYLNQNSPVYYNSICDCPSLDALADPRDKNPKREPCALTTTDFPLRPGQAVTTDPDDPKIFEDTKAPITVIKVKKHKSRKRKSKKSKSPSVIKLKLRLKKSKSDSRGRKRSKSRRSSNHSDSSYPSVSSVTSRSSCNSNKNGYRNGKRKRRGKHNGKRSHRSNSSQSARRRSSFSSVSRDSGYDREEC